MSDGEPTRENQPTAPQSGSEALGCVWKDRYLIERELGRGGFGVVYLARDQQLLSKPVVIKVLQEGASPDPYFQKKFRQEIEALARIDHPGVVGILDVGETPEGKPFLVMQFVEGVTLRPQISSLGIELPRVAHIMRQVGHALSAAHEKGVYHRDLKPENIMLQQVGENEEYVKLIDFGIATVKDSQVPAQGQTSKVIGTVAYMAPEQLFGKPAPASDIYALGVIAYEMLTGQRPEMSPQGPTVKPRTLCPSLSEAAQEILLQALSFQPENRPVRPRDFGDQLATALEIETAKTVALPAARPSAPEPSPPSSLEMAYVLFMDLVGYSALPMDRQSQRIQQLQEIVRSTPEFRRAQQSDQLISLPTGDGMALVFFQNPVAPVQCATEISRVLKNHPDLQLRMGVHTGPVYRIADINTNRNVAGGGINLAQRVMDCGDAGHILVSKTVADILGQLSQWTGTLHDFGEHEVKHGVKVQLVNLYTGEAGNPALPEKLRTRTFARPQPQPLPQRELQASPAKNRRSAYLVVGGVAAAVLMVFGAIRLSQWGKSPEDRNAPMPATMAPSLPSPPASPPPPATPPPQTPPAASTPSAPAPSPPPAQPQPGAAPAPIRPLGAAIRRRLSGQGIAPAPQQSTRPQPGQLSPSASSPPAPEIPSSSDRALLRELRERMILLAARARAVHSSMENLARQQRQSGLGMRPDMAAAGASVQYLMEEARNSLAAGDAETAKRNLDLAERQIEKLEGFLGR